MGPNSYLIEKGGAKLPIQFSNGITLVLN